MNRFLLTASFACWALLSRAVEPLLEAPRQAGQAALRARVEWLADPAREGRATGSPGARASASYIAEFFEGLGLVPLGKDFLQSFEFDAGVKLLEDRNRLGISQGDKARRFEVNTDFMPLSFSDSREAEAEVVFAGYGLSVPEGNGNRYNSYDGLNVKDKIVLMLRYVPEGVDPQRRAQLNRYAGLRYKAMLARERGAKAVLFVSGPNSPQAGEVIGLNGDGTLAGSGILALSISAAVADQLLSGTGKDLKAVQTELDDENPHASGGTLLLNKRMSLSVGVEHLRRSDQNVVAVLPPAAPSGDSVAATEYVVLGAHYDHLGFGRGSSSMARAGEESKVHPGADDNASGVAAIMEIATALVAERQRNPKQFTRGIIFACWSGEEIGLIGSNAFCEKPPIPLKNVLAYINFDMVGRLRDNKLTVQGVGSSKVWRPWVQKHNAEAKFQLVLQEDPYLPTDTTSFYPKGIPVLNFFTGAHEDYHRPTDTAEKLDYVGLKRIATFAQAIAEEVANAPERPDLARVEHADPGPGSRENLRAYLGTIPDYSSETTGVKISGVRGGSPAEKAGIQGGDVIIELGGQKIANIYDYTYALDSVKIGAAIPVVVLRKDERVNLTVTPEIRR